jgi:hypothetical protein
MALTSSNAVRQLSDGNSQGTVLGKSATDTIGFYGVTTPVARTVFGTTAATVTLVSVTGSTAGQGFSTVALFGAYCSTVMLMQADLADLRTRMVNLGLFS